VNQWRGCSVPLIVGLLACWVFVCLGVGGVGGADGAVFKEFEAGFFAGFGVRPGFGEAEAGVGFVLGFGELEAEVGNVVELGGEFGVFDLEAAEFGLEGVAGGGGGGEFFAGVGYLALEGGEGGEAVFEVFLLGFEDGDVGGFGLEVGVGLLGGGLGGFEEEVGLDEVVGGVDELAGALLGEVVEVAVDLGGGALFEGEAGAEFGDLVGEGFGLFEVGGGLLGGAVAAFVPAEAEGDAGDGEDEEEWFHGSDLA